MIFRLLTMTMRNLKSFFLLLGHVCKMNLLNPVSNPSTPSLSIITLQSSTNGHDWILLWTLKSLYVNSTIWFNWINHVVSIFYVIESRKPSWLINVMTFRCFEVKGLNAVHLHQHLFALEFQSAMFPLIIQHVFCQPNIFINLVQEQICEKKRNSWCSCSDVNVSLLSIRLWTCNITSCNLSSSFYQVRPCTNVLSMCTTFQ